MVGGGVISVFVRVGWRGTLQEAGRCSVRSARPDSWLVSISLSGGRGWMDEGAGERPGAKHPSGPDTRARPEGGWWETEPRFCVRLAHGHVIVIIILLLLSSSRLRGGGG